jgi:hypothetical protein
MMCGSARPGSSHRSNPVAGPVGGLELAERDADGPIGHVMPRVGVEADDEHARMMAAGGQHQEVQVFEVLDISGKYGH